MALEHATLTNRRTSDSVPVLFNPEEYTVTRGVTWAQAAIPGREAPLLQFVNGEMQTLEMELLVDTLEAHGSAPAGGDVRELTEKITGFMNVDGETHAPPVVVFAWGTLVFTCVVARVTQRFVMFLPTGVPVRARLSVTLNEYRDLDLEAKEVKRQTADYTKRHVVLQEETLSSIATKVYGNPALWRAIALRNELDDPRTLEPGLALAIPSLPYRDPQTGEVHA